MDEHLPDAAWLRRVRQRLTTWYRRNARPLPWRLTHDPYRIWLSEIMLQQTTVAAVIPYFERFLKRFPTLADLAGAPEDDVLHAWEGLGYYSRARNLRKAAQCILHDHAGVFPSDADVLRELPGIGRYTAGAIASFAFDRREPIVEANTLRLYCRLMGFGGDPRSAAGSRLLWEFAARVLPGKSPGLFNQALMELGAKVCTVERPNCPNCPLRMDCVALARGVVDHVPRPAPRPEITAVAETAIAVRKANHYLLMKRAEGERWAGLWDFVRFPDQALVDGQQSPAEQVRTLTGIDVVLGPRVAEIRHSVTRYRITLACYVADWKAGRIAAGGNLRWVAPDDLAALPFSVTGRKLARLLEERA